jgi:putative flavoprotein involved in K+ transport
MAAAAPALTMRRVGTLIIGAGQAGLALSWHLTHAGADHVLLERGRIGERWRTERWRSLALLTPNWANRLPGSPEPADPDGYLLGSAFVSELERYAASFGAPVYERTAVTAIERGRGGFRVTTDRGRWRAEAVVLATGDGAVPGLPWFAASVPDGIDQVTASRYREPRGLRPGGVLVVGGGPSGHQIAHELATAGRQVLMAVGRHARMPRRYRGRDVWWWMRELGELDRADGDAGQSGVHLPLDGRGGGRTLDLGVLAAEGVRPAGRLEGFAGDHALFGDGLVRAAEDADERLRRFLARCDARVDRPFPLPDPPAPLRVEPGPRSVDLRREGVTTILWATGSRPHHPWLRVPGALAPDGRIVHTGGRTPVPGLHVLGTRWLRRATSHMIGGVGADAAELAARLPGARSGVLAEAA